MIFHWIGIVKWELREGGSGHWSSAAAAAAAAAAAGQNSIPPLRPLDSISHLQLCVVVAVHIFHTLSTNDDAVGQTLN